MILIISIWCQRDIFRDIVFGYLLDVPRLQGDELLFHKMFLHQIQLDPVLSPDGIKRLYFRVCDTKMVYGQEEFCLITGFNFGEYPKNIGKKVSEKIVTSKKDVYCFGENQLPEKYIILNQTFLEVDDVDAVRVCLIYILCEGFLGKEINDRVPQDCFFLLRIWMSGTGYMEKINKYLSLPERRQTLKYSVSGFTAPIRIWIYEMLPAVRASGFVLRKK
uniref:DUF1985 domain-containing protein n=1 Tax=Lactuca sativa TaxID=4236 RepID=A0A9R1VXI2_LACSA|nr:hypothetical protein LSAT_V11C400210130 [Lactuca sativa]